MRTFNCGIGMLLVVDPARADAVRAALLAAGEIVHTIGTVAAAAGRATGRVHRARDRMASAASPS